MLTTLSYIRLLHHDVQTWLLINKFKMNEEKTEVLLCDPKKMCNPLDKNHININNEKIAFSTSAKNLGVYFDENLTMELHVSNLCKILFCALRRIGQMSMILNRGSLKTLISAFVFSRLL